MKMNNGWTVEYIDLNLHNNDMLMLPTERILHYRFTNSDGRSFRMHLLDDGQVEINCDEQLVVYPRATNRIHLKLVQF